MLGISFDSASDAVNFKHGRWPKGAGGPPADPTPGKLSRSERDLLKAARLAQEYDIELKVPQ
jgi:hypothetical protein